MSNLILGLATGYPAAVYQRFLGSLRSSGYQGAVVLFATTPIAPDVLDACESYSAQTETFTAAPYHIQSYRYELYESWLATQHPEIENILLTDVSDVVFQRDPFSFPLPAGADLYFFAEKRIIGACRYNSGWLMHAFGEKVLKKLAHQAILCSGTTIGQPAAIRSYLRAMNSITGKLRANKLEILCGLDQGIHNYIAYCAGLEPFRVANLDNESGPVNTMGYARKELSADGWITNSNGDISFLAHQFNRMNVDQLQTLQRWRGWPLTDLFGARRKVDVGDLLRLELSWSQSPGSPFYFTKLLEYRLGEDEPLPGLLRALQPLYEGDTTEIMARTQDQLETQVSVKIAGITAFPRVE